MQLAPAGDRAVLVELGDVTAAELHAWNACVRALPGVVRTIHGHSSLSVIFDSQPDSARLARCHPERSEGPGRVGRQHRREQLRHLRFHERHGRRGELLDRADGAGKAVIPSEARDLARSAIEIRIRSFGR